MRMKRDPFGILKRQGWVPVACFARVSSSNAGLLHTCVSSLQYSLYDESFKRIASYFPCEQIFNPLLFQRRGNERSRKKELQGMKEAGKENTRE